MTTNEARAQEGVAHTGWKPHWMRQRDGQGGWTLRPAQIQFMQMPTDLSMGAHHRDFVKFCPFGVAQMDNGEIVLVGVCDHSAKKEKTVVCFSSDRGETWTAPKRIGRFNYGRPMYLADLGEGNLTFIAQYKDETIRFFSKDYGRTWPRRVPHSIGLAMEGNPHVELGPDGKTRRMAITGTTLESLKDWPYSASENHFCWSDDGGRTYRDDVVPPEWYWDDVYDGRTYRRGCSEGSVIRAANGWLVAALRPDVPAMYFAGDKVKYEDYNDNMEGAGISISQDDGKTWSPLNVIFPAGRMHPHLLRMSDNVLVMTYIMRQDLCDGRVASYTRGCGALVSHDHGLTWDMDRETLLDSFQFADGTKLALGCGHIYSALLDDGTILTCYGNYLTKGGCLIKWRPTNER